MTSQEDRREALADDPFIDIGTDDDGLRVLVADVIGRYERAMGLIDNLLDRRTEMLGEHTSRVVWELLLERIKDNDRFRLLRAVLVDVDSEAPFDAVLGICREVKELRDRCAHAAAWIIESGIDGPVVAFYAPRRRKTREPLRITEAELIAHHHRLAWATDWLTHLQYTDSTFTTGSEWEQVWQQTMPTPRQAAPSRPRPSGVD